MSKSCLVLEGGALRAIYTAGVIDLLLKEKINVDAIIGVSAGALFGCNYVSKQEGRTLRYNLKYLNDKHYMGFWSFITTGNIMNKDFCFNKLIYELDPFDFDTFNKSNVDFYATVTNVETGKAEYHLFKDIKNEMEYLRASGSMPFLSKFVNIDGKKYLDGGIADSIPVKKAQEMGYDKIIVVTTQVKEYVKEPYKMFPFKVKYHKYKNLLNVIKNRHNDYNEITKYINEEEEKNNIFVIRPSRKVNISRLEKDKEIVKEQYNLGFSDAKNKLKELKKYLKK